MWYKREKENIAENEKKAHSFHEEDVHSYAKVRAKQQNRRMQFLKKMGKR